MNNNDPGRTTTNANQGKPEGKLFDILRPVALVALVVGATGSLIFMFRAGEHTPRFLLVLFTVWVLSPVRGPLLGIQSFEALVGPDTGDALLRDAHRDSEFFGHIR